MSTFPAAGPWGPFLYWLHHNITAGLHGDVTVQMVGGRLVISP